MEATLVLADGTTFRGEAAGWQPPDGIAVGEVVFNTVLSGYQEVITDPSYAGQIITFTASHIGNYGVNDADDEAGRPHCRGVVVRDLTGRPSNWRSQASLPDFLVRHRIPAITGVDTRRLTRVLRDRGAMPGAFGTAAEADLLAAARADGGTDGRDYVAQVTCAAPYRVAAGPDAGARRIVAYDFGLKTSIVEQLRALGEVEVVPAGTPAEEVLAGEPDGVFLSNGPGDPAALGHIVSSVSALVGHVPIFGICLGHQLLGQALGATTFKLPFGHHGGNQPIRRAATGQVEIASHNHNYAIDPASLPAGVEVTHVNLNDNTVGGLRDEARWCYSVQYHPEAGPGPHDPRYLFTEFAELMDSWKEHRAAS
jgi:carbamoyl-phosphate synthase small subunit